MAYPNKTTPRSYGGAVPPAYITSDIPAYYTMGQTITISNAAGWYEIDDTGHETTNPLGTSGPFTVAVNIGKTNEEKILCSNINIADSVITVWTDGTLNGRGYDGTIISTHNHQTTQTKTSDIFHVFGAVEFLQFNEGIIAALIGGQGTIGPQGPQGVRGAQGPRGFQGNQGYQGNPGNDGLDGVQGAQGLQGSTGTQGYQGATGTGTQGAQGAQGAQGSQGSTGAQGTTGAQGFQGAQGLGTQGPQGYQGLTGSGTQGFQGYQGSQGYQGNVGDPGIYESNNGTPPVNHNILWLDDTAPAAGPQGAQGTQGVQGVQGATGYQGSQGNQGAQGANGTNGTQGSQGVQGTQGITGYQGSQGNTGPQGPAAGITYVSGVPANKTSTGALGQIAIDNANSILYVCVATNTWNKVSLNSSTFTNPGGFA